MNSLSDDVYRLIHKYVFFPHPELERWNETTSRWVDFPTTKCHVCNRHAYKSNIPLSHICKVCDNGISGVCENLLICRECADLY